MGKPAAKVGDQHMCPKVTPGTPPVPHIGGPVMGGCLTVLINGQPAARVGDSCTCVGEPDLLTTGSSGVFIGGKPAARMGDQTAHGGKIVAGNWAVEIGEKKIPRILKKPGAINDAIEISIVLLENKLQLLERNDPDTISSFKEWFGQDDEGARGIILERIRRVLEVSIRLKVENFNSINNVTKSKKSYGSVYSWDKNHIILLGDKFWNKGDNKKLKAGVVIHELSHFRDVGNTDDFTYGEIGCLELAKGFPKEAMSNADSFEFFIRE